MNREFAEQLMRRAIEEGYAGVAAGQSPFAAVVAHPTEGIICAAHNTVFADCDPSAHGEVAAIRRCCAELGTIDLTGYIIASTCEPCPMCASAIHWARLSHLIYGATIDDARDAGFNELFVSCSDLYRQGGSPVQVEAGILQEESRQLFADWKKGNPRVY